MSNGTEKKGGVEDIMNLSGGGAFAAALAAPVLAPAPLDLSGAADSIAPAKGGNKYIMFGMLGLGIMFLLGVGILVMFMKQEPKATTVPSASSGAGAGIASGTAPENAAPQTADPSTAGAIPSDSKAAPTSTAKNPLAGNAAAPKDPTAAKAPTGGGAAHESPGAGAAPAAAPEAPKPAAQPKNFNDALAAAAGASAAPAAAPAGNTGSSAPFDRGAASASLNSINVASCKKPDGPTGSGHVTVTFGPDGSVQSAVADQPPFAGTPVGGCVAGKFRGAHVPAFGGSPVRVGKSFVIN
jgi:hypothetical protein